MQKYFLIFIFSFFVIFGIDNAYSLDHNSLDHNSLDHNSLIINDKPIIMIDHAKYNFESLTHIITFDNPITGKFDIKFPKNIPIIHQFDEKTGLNYLTNKIVLSNGLEIPVEFYESDCFFNYSLSLNNTSTLELLYWYILEKKYSFLSIDFNPICNNIFESLKQINTFRTCDNSHTTQLTHKIEQVCIYPESIMKLIKRGYLV